MKLRTLFVPVGMLALLSCATDSSATVGATDVETLKGSPAGLVTLGFLDMTSTLPGLLTSTYNACVTATPTSATSVSLALAACPSATGGTLAGTVTETDTPSGAVHNYVETFASLVATRSSTLQWTYAGTLDAMVNGANASLNWADGFTLTVTDTKTPANDKAWTFAGGVTVATANGGLSLYGAFSAVSGTTDAVDVTIDALTPLTWVKGGTFPVSGTMTIKDARQNVTNPETLTAVFSSGQVTLNGGTITLGQ